MPRKITIASVLFLALATALGGSSAELLLAEDDDDSGGDTLSTAVTIDGTGTIEGTLSDLDDADWYEWPDAEATSASCVQLDVSGDVHAEASLVRETADGQRWVEDLVTPTLTATTAQTFTGEATWYVGVEANPDTADDDEEVTGDYIANLTRLDAEDVTSDAGSGTDASNQPWQKNVIDIEPRCLGGILGGDDDRDTYSLTAYDGDVLDVTLDHAPANGSDGDVRLSVLDPDYNEVLTIGPGDAGNVSIDENGTWYLQFSSTTSSYDGVYLAGVGQIEHPPCRPNC